MLRYVLLCMIYPKCIVLPSGVKNTTFIHHQSPSWVKLVRLRYFTDLRGLFGKYQKGELIKKSRHVLDCKKSQNYIE